jgi:diguanylate cyclase (GGDEF)-like protein
MTKVLVIEDEPAIRNNLVVLLEKEGFEALPAENGLVGVELARVYHPDLIICDITMPELDGYGVLDKLRQDTTTASIPFIFLTARSDKADLRRGMLLGADDFLSKPYTRVELLEAIRTRLAKQAAIARQYASALEQTQVKLDYLLLHDSLTDLPNRRALQVYFNQLLEASQQNISVLALSIDRFNRVNDSLGYVVGDLLLKAVTERLLSCVDAGESVARLQSGRFALVLPNDQPEQAAEIARNILSCLSGSFNLAGYEVFITSSIGIAHYPKDGNSMPTLIKHAENAMRYAKRLGGNTVQLYSRELAAESEADLLLETDLRYALERSELELYYQPQVDLRTGKIVGAEALLRWHHPKYGPVQPLRFIPLAEENRMIIPIGEWSLKTACRQTQAWQAAGYGPLRMAVNLSSLQFAQPDLSQRIIEILDQTKLDPQYLELELTESSLVQNVNEALDTMNKLKAMNVRISIDDFGMGYSSLGYLKQFPFDSLKVDQYFVRNITNNPENAAITQAIIHMAKSLGLKVIAEGVETAAELAFLRLQQCDEIQGYFFSHPLPARQFEDLLANNKLLQLEEDRR